jgi:hypothetical protein
MYKLLFLFAFIQTSLVFATTFVPVSIKNQIKESHGIIKGEVHTMESIELENGKIATKVEIYIDKYMNVEVNDDLAAVYFPGGTLGDIKREVEGAPKFSVGEKIVLFTKKIEERNWVQNLGLGKFSIKRVGSNYILVNQVFPQLANVGQMSLDNFLNLAQRVKSKKFVERYKDKYELSNEKQARAHVHKKTKRSIASVEGVDSSSKFQTFWLVFILGFLGVFFAIRRKKNE